MGINDLIVVQFVIDRGGNVTAPNILKGINEGLYRQNLDIDNYVKFYYTLIFNINENTMLEKDAQELELKALEYHIRAMATLEGIAELEKQLEIQNQNQ